MFNDSTIIIYETTYGIEHYNFSCMNSFTNVFYL